MKNKAQSILAVIGIVGLTLSNLIEIVSYYDNFFYNIFFAVNHIIALSILYTIVLRITPRQYLPIPMIIMSVEPLCQFLDRVPYAVDAPMMLDRIHLFHLFMNCLIWFVPAMYCMLRQSRGICISKGKARVFSTILIITFVVFMFNETWIDLWYNNESLDYFVSRTFCLTFTLFINIWAMNLSEVDNGDESTEQVQHVYATIAEDAATSAYENPGEEYEEDFGDYSIGLVRHILFYIFFGFVWRFIWIYKMTYFTNRATSEPYRNPTTKLLLCLFVPLYYFYWLYQTSLRVDQIAKEHGINSNLTVICPLTSFVADIISVVIMQERVNRMVEMHKISE